jgi:hypothetical protein
MAENEQNSNAQELQELRNAIEQRGWEDSADFITREIEFVTDLCVARKLATGEIQRFRRETQVTVDSLMDAQDRPYVEEIRGLRKALQDFNHAQESLGRTPPSNDESRTWTLAKARLWHDHLDSSRQKFELICLSWRFNLLGAMREHFDRCALACIEEIERRLPILRLGRLADVELQREAIEKCVIFNAKLTVYADDSDCLKLYSSHIVGLPADEADAFKKVAAFSRAICHSELKGEEGWLQHVEPIHWLVRETGRLAALYENDGRLDSNEELIHERAYVDPLYLDTGEVLAPGTIDKASFELSQHPDVRMEVEDLKVVFKTAGLKGPQREALLMRANGKIMSRKDVKEWKRSQRAISSNRSKIVKVIAAATKKRTIKAPRISAGSDPGVIREGAAYTFPFPDEDEPMKNSRGPKSDSTKWFESAPPPISRSVRKTKHLFRKVSTQS